MVKAKGSQFGDAKLLTEKPCGIASFENPVVQQCFYSADSFEQGTARSFKELSGPGKECLPGAEELKFFACRILSVIAAKLCGLKLTGGDVHVSNANRRARCGLGYGGEEVVLASLQHGGFGSRAGGDHTHHFAADEFFARSGLLHLL